LAYFREVMGKVQHTPGMEKFCKICKEEKRQEEMEVGHGEALVEDEEWRERRRVEEMARLMARIREVEEGGA
jgi:hypothetical protein